MAAQIDPKTGERVGAAPSIDPATGERMSGVAGAGPMGTPDFATAPKVNMETPAIAQSEEEGLKDVGHRIGSNIMGAGRMVKDLPEVLQHPRGAYLAHDPAAGFPDYKGAHGLTDAAGDVATVGLMGGAAKAAPLLSEPMMEAGGGLINKAAGTVKSDFSHGATPGRAYLEGGGTPALTMRGLAEKAAAVKESAGQKLGEAYSAASKGTPPKPVAGLLQAPQYDVALQSSPDVAGTPSRPVVLNQADRPMRPAISAPREEIPTGPRISDRPEPNSGVLLRPFEGGQAEGMGPGQYFGQVSGERGGLGSPQGVLRTRNPETAGQLLEAPPSNPIPVGATRIPAESVRDALLSPVNRLRAVQNGPGGVGASPMLDEYQANIEPHIQNDFTPRQLFDLKRNVSANTRWSDPTMLDMKAVRQQGVGAVGGLLNEAVPETVPLNRIYQGSGNLAERAGTRADTGSPPLSTLVHRGVEGAAGAALGYATHNPLLAALPLAADSIPVKTGAGYLLYHGGRAAGAVPPSAGAAGLLFAPPRDTR